jgi:hypothetical protein
LSRGLADLGMLLGDTQTCSFDPVEPPLFLKPCHKPQAGGAGGRVFLNPAISRISRTISHASLGVCLGRATRLGEAAALSGPMARTTHSIARNRKGSENAPDVSWILSTHVSCLAREKKVDWVVFDRSIEQWTCLARDGDFVLGPGATWGGGVGALWSGQRCGGRDWGPGPGAACGRSRGRVPWGSYREGSRGKCGEGARCSPRGRMRARRRCGEGRVDDTWRRGCTITGTCGKTIEVSLRQLLHTVDEKPRGNRRGSLRTPSQTIRLARPMQHDACSKQQVACNMLHANGKQQKCNFLHAPTPKPKPRQRRANERTMADSDMSVNLAPEAVVATTSGAGG